MYGYGYRYSVRPGYVPFNPLTDIDGLSLYLNKNTNVNTKIAADFVAANSEYLSSSSTDFDFTTQSFTCEGWFRWTTTLDDFAFFNKWNGTGNQRGFMCYKDATDNLRFRVSTDGTAVTTDLITSNTYAINTWHYVAFVFDSVNELLKISVNGADFEVLAHSGGIFNSSDDFIIGFTYAANYLDGRADALNVSQKAKTLAELKATYNSGNGTSYPSLEDLNGNTYAIGQSLSGADAFNIDSVLTPLASTTKGTIEFYVNPNNIGAFENVFCSFMDTSASEGIEILSTGGGGGLFEARARIGGVIKWALRTTASPFTNGVTSKCKLVFDGASSVLYVDDVAPTQSYTSVGDKDLWFNGMSGIDNARIGCRNFNGGGNTLFTDGTIQNVKIWSDDTQTTQVADWLMNDVEGADQTDSINGYNATPIGTPVSTLASVDNTTITTIESSLVSWWDLNETSGTRFDSVTASGNDLTDNNTWLCAWKSTR